MTFHDTLTSIEDYTKTSSNPWVRVLSYIATPLLYCIGTLFVFLQDYTNSESLKILQVSLGILLAFVSLIWAFWKNRLITQEIIAHFKKVFGNVKKSILKKKK